MLGPATPPLGSGSFRMATGAGNAPGAGGKVYLVSPLCNHPITGLSLSYSTYVSQTQVTHLAPYVNLFTTAGTFVYEPVYQDAVQLNTWQSWNASAGRWWYVPEVQAGGFSLQTLGDWASQLGNPQILATVLVVGQASGGIWANFTGYVDNVLTNGVLYDFEPAAPSNNPPTASDDSVQTNEDMAASITLIANDPDGDPLTYTVLSQPLHGTLSGSAANRTYTPYLNYNSPDSFTFQVSDGSLSSNVATVYITVYPVNDAPTALPFATTKKEDNKVNVDLWLLAYVAQLGGNFHHFRPRRLHFSRV